MYIQIYVQLLCIHDILLYDSHSLQILSLFGSLSFNDLTPEKPTSLFRPIQM